MKKIIFAVAIVVTVASCTSRQSTDQTKVLAAFKDSVEYADYLKWKKEQPTMQVVQREKETKIIAESFPSYCSYIIKKNGRPEVFWRTEIFKKIPIFGSSIES